MSKIVIHKGTLNHVTYSTTTEIEEGYELVEINWFTWFLAKHGVMWMALWSVPPHVAAWVCFHKNVDNETFWVLGLLGLSMALGLITFLMAISAYNKVWGE